MLTKFFTDGFYDQETHGFIEHGTSYDCRNLDHYIIKIAKVSFAYDNEWAYVQLAKRGNYIKKRNFPELKKLNEYIQDKLTYKQELLNRLSRPVTVFLTFESDYGM